MVRELPPSVHVNGGEANNLSIRPSPESLKAGGQGLSRKPSRLSLFRSRSDSRKLGWGAASDSDASTSTTSRRPSRFKKLRYSTDKSTRSQGAIETDTDNSEAGMLRFTQGFSQPTLPSYSKLPEERAAPRNYGSITSTPRSAPRLPDNHDWTTVAGPGPSIGQTSTRRVHRDNELPIPMDDFESNQRRKASMTKLMRHFGETRIPPELVSAVPGQNAAPVVTSDERIRSLRKERTKSLDLKALVLQQRSENSGIEGQRASHRVHRTRSVGVRSAKASRHENENEPLDGGETIHHRVRRTRKMAQILGPELPHELMANPHDDRRAVINPVPPQIRSPVTQLDLPSFNTEIFKSVSKFTDDPLLDPPSPPLSPTTEDRKRARKLAKFFGVSQQDISSSPHSTGKRASSLSSASSNSPSRDVEVKVAGRRFWSLSPDKVEFRDARMTDAIDRLRTLKAS